MITRDVILNKSLELAEHNQNTILMLATGVGKTYISLKIIEKLGGKWYIILAENAHKQNWLDEIDKWQLNHLLPNITFFLYASVHKYKNTIRYGIICDEVHHAFTNLRSGYIKSIKRKKFVGLSATLKREHLSLIQAEFHPSKIDHSKGLETLSINNGVLLPVLLKHALEWSILPEPKVYLIPIELNTELNQELVKTKGKKTPIIKDVFENRFKYLGKKKNYTLKLQCSEQDLYDDINGLMAYFQKSKFSAEYKYVQTRSSEDLKKLKILEALYLRKGLDRKNFLARLKIPIAKQLIKKLKSKRFILFANSIEEIQELGGSNAVHSKNTTKENERIINSFNNKKINSLFAVGMLKEGMNLTDIEIGIITQLSGTELNNIQMIGRSIRAKDPIQYIIYVKDTQDEVYLNRMLKDFDKSLIQEVSIDEI